MLSINQTCTANTQTGTEYIPSSSRASTYMGIVQGSSETILVARNDHPEVIRKKANIIQQRLRGNQSLLHRR